MTKPASIAPKTAAKRERDTVAALLGSHDEVTNRFKQFAEFWAANPGIARYALQNEARELLPNERVKKCLRHRISKSELIKGIGVPLKGSAHFGNLQVCASVWNCPVCAAKITTRKRIELSEGIKIWGDRGNRVLLTTFTLQHKINEPCADVLKGLTDSFLEFWRGGWSNRLRAEYRIVGRVRGLETTYTLENGWHTHIHDLWFPDIKKGLPPNLINELRQKCVVRWQHVLSKHNRYADSIHGFDIRVAEKEIADYVAKYGKEDLSGIAEKAHRWKTWTEAHEVTLGPIKRGNKKRESFTPQQLLALSLAGDEFAGRLFTEYAKAFKGSSQVRWSRGLRDLLGMKKEKTDKEIADEKNEKGLYIVGLETQQYKVVLGNDAHAELLKVIGTCDSWAVLEFLEDLGVTRAVYPQLKDDPSYLQPGWEIDVLVKEGV